MLSRIRCRFIAGRRYTNQALVNGRQIAIHQSDTIIPLSRETAYSHSRNFATKSSTIKSTLENDSIAQTSAPRNPLPSKILIANRGEIACRVIRTCKKLGIQTVAIFSEADSKAAHTLLADEAYCIGPAPSAESYLCMDRIIEVCLKSGAEMVHPGYGFLSENAEFAEKLASSGITFIGPPVQAIISMGSKSASKEIMTKAGVPCVPGYHGNDQSDENLQLQAEKIGYPVLIKAIKGGGGKGMKIVNNLKEFQDQLQSARREAKTSFGDSDVLIERYLTKPRHVEVQIVSSGKPFNEHVAISTRDCSIQRRHQKIIEEAPAPHLTIEVEKDLCEKAVAAAKAVSYQGAGTVEFILDADTGEAWFLECNTRLQVEHPISEMVSGIDLVEWQLEVASGNSLPLKQEEIKNNGHAFEARIYAEDTRSNFLPDVGFLSHVSFPSPTTSLLSLENSNSPLASIRIDTGVSTGDEVSVFYDPMIAKVIVHGRDRQDALRLMRLALKETQIVGPKTNVDFLKNLCKHKAFIDGSGLETGFIGKYIKDLHPTLDLQEKPEIESIIHAGLFLALKGNKDDNNTNESFFHPWSTKSEFTSFRNSTSQSTSISFTLRNRVAGGQREEEEVLPPATSTIIIERIPFHLNHFKIKVDNQDQGLFSAKLSIDELNINVERLEKDYDKFLNSKSISKVITQPASRINQFSTISRLDIFMSNGNHSQLELIAPNWYKKLLKISKVAESSKVISPMPSKIVQVKVKEGDFVEKGEILIILEAMKTEHTLRSSKSGTILKINAKQGEMCSEGSELLIFKDDDVIQEGEEVEKEGKEK